MSRDPWTRERDFVTADKIMINYDSRGSVFVNDVAEFAERRTIGYAVFHASGPSGVTGDPRRWRIVVHGTPSSYDWSHKRAGAVRILVALLRARRFAGLA